MKSRKFITPLLLLGLLISCLSNKSSIDHTKIKGFAFAGSSYNMDSLEVTEIKNIGSNWVCWMPYAYVLNDGRLIDTSSRQWWGESYAGVKQCIQWSKSHNLKVCVKPHIWFLNGTFSGDFSCQSEAEWQKFEASYRNYILKFAELADHEKAELFCIGVEFKTFIKQRPLFWKSLISEVRKIYSGKITYAANWDNYDKVPFWNQLDIIGIDAYFSYSDQETPTVSELKKSMEDQSDQLEVFSKQNNKPISFLEYGFRSKNNCCYKPYEHHNSNSANYLCQQNAYKAFFDTFYSKHWFKGGFIWKWFASKHYKEEGEDGYTIKGKPVMETIKAAFSK